MKIVSRFTDGYDFEESVSRNDSVVYLRKSTHTELSDSKRTSLRDIPSGIYLKVGSQVKLLRFGRTNTRARDLTVNYPVFRYDIDTKSTHELQCTARRSYFATWSNFYLTYLQPTAGFEIHGKVFVNKGLVKFIELANFEEVTNTKVLKYMKGEVSLMCVEHGELSVVNDINLLASDLLPAFKVKFGDNLSSLIDMNLSTKEAEDDFEITDKELLTRKGFDSKKSFRHRKANKGK